MEKLDKLIEHIRSVRKSLPNIVKEALQENEKLIIETVRDEQLFEQGVNGFGVNIMSYDPYAPSTIKRKRQKNQPTDRVTLKDSGDFYRKFYVEFKAKEFRVFSSDSKAEHLADRYGSSIFVLTVENRKAILSSVVRPKVLEKLRK